MVTSSTTTYDATDAWPYWCTGTDTTSFTTSSTSNDWTWREWCTSTTATTTGYNAADTAWVIWCEERPVEIRPITITVRQRQEQYSEETRLRFEEARRMREEARKKAEALRKKRKKAENAALELMQELIGPEQRKIYEETGKVLIRGEKADYLLNRGGAVKRIEKDKVVDLCIHLKGGSKYPETDNVIALMLAVGANEEGFNRMANEHGAIPADEYVMPECANGNIL
jgi:hypothetical protein